jgi:hypothetical protein
MRTNSPISDPQVTQLPVTPKVVKPPKTEWAKLGGEKKYAEIDKYIEARKEFWRMYLPDGTRIQDVSKEVRDQWWACAATIIGEYEDFQAKITTEVILSKQR